MSYSIGRKKEQPIITGNMNILFIISAQLNMSKVGDKDSSVPLRVGSTNFMRADEM